MRQKVINKLQNGEILLTLLNPLVSPSTIINNTNYKEFGVNKLIVDTAVKNKLSEFRFMSIPLDDKGNVIYDNLKYFVPNSKLVTEANTIISQYNFELSHSFMTKRQIEDIKIDALFAESC